MDLSCFLLMEEVRELIYPAADSVVRNSSLRVRVPLALIGNEAYDFFNTHDKGPPCTLDLAG